jgi:hypothetical protein
MCNIFDCVQGAVKYDIDSIRDITDTDLCNQRVLNNLQNKLGFFTDVKMNSDTQRIILKAFPYIVKNKGSRKGIEQAIQVFLKTQNVSGEIKVVVHNKRIVSDMNTHMDILQNVYVVQVAISTKLLDITILDEILKYIIPAGYIINYIFYNPLKLNTIVQNSDTINVVFVHDSLNSGIRLSGMDFGVLPINAVSTTNIANNTIDNLIYSNSDVQMANNINDVKEDKQYFTSNRDIRER